MSVACGKKHVGRIETPRGQSGLKTPCSTALNGAGNLTPAARSQLTWPMKIFRPSGDVLQCAIRCWFFNRDLDALKSHVVPAVDLSSGRRNNPNTQCG